MSQLSGTGEKGGPRTIDLDLQANGRLRLQGSFDSGKQDNRLIEVEPAALRQAIDRIQLPDLRADSDQVLSIKADRVYLWIKKDINATSGGWGIWVNTDELALLLNSLPV